MHYVWLYGTSKLHTRWQHEKSISGLNAAYYKHEQLPKVYHILNWVKYFIAQIQNDDGVLSFNT